MYIYKYLLPDRKHLHPYGDFRWKKSPHPNGPWINPGQTAESFVSVVSATSAASQQTALTVHGEGTVSLAAWPSCWSPLKGGLGPKKYPLYKMYTGLIPKGYHLKGTTIFPMKQGMLGRWASWNPKLHLLENEHFEPNKWRFGSSDFPDFNWVIFSFHVNFQGCKGFGAMTNDDAPILGEKEQHLWSIVFCWIPCWFSLAIVNN